jgi:SAP domain-containing ribonucleoprotein
MSDSVHYRELAQDPEFKAMQQQAADSEKHTTAAAAEPSAAAPPSSDEKKPAEPVEQVKPGSNFKFTPITFDKPAESDAPSAPAKSEAERRLERAKRFGVAVQDTVKKELRAQKFGSTEPTAKAPAPAATADDAAAAAAPARPRASVSPYNHTLHTSITVPQTDALTHLSAS